MLVVRFLTLAAILSAIFSCSTQSNSTQSPTKVSEANNANLETVEGVTPKPVENKQNTVNVAKREGSIKQACEGVTRDDLMLDKKQTFAVDFKPFEKSCFVTFHNPEFDNPPLGSEFYIYKDGKEVFSFPEPFGGGNATCWVDAVGFEDVNDDQLTDILIVGKCGSKARAYNENMVYMNNGKEFVTNAEANAETMDFSKISQIRDYVKKNPKMFVP